jgi:hypothetical protein
VIGVVNHEVERVAIEYVMQLERAAGRCPEDVHLRGVPYDISSPPRKIEVKAFSKSARGEAVPLEQRQFQAANEDRTKIAAEEKTRIVLSVLAGETTRAQVARSISVSSVVVAYAGYRE